MLSCQVGCAENISCRVRSCERAAHRSVRERACSAPPFSRAAEQRRRATSWVAAWSFPPLSRSRAHRDRRSASADTADRGRECPDACSMCHRCSTARRGRSGSIERCWSGSSHFSARIRLKRCLSYFGRRRGNCVAIDSGLRETLRGAVFIADQCGQHPGSTAAAAKSSRSSDDGASSSD